ncbi:MAG TPA: hypothetical protein VFZ47_06400, partial [Chitinophagaceae bacterium]
MKRFSTLAIALALCCTVQSQVLNELYTNPGAGKHEFFELYNNSIYQTPTSMDTYAMVTYYENSPIDKGFYIMDMPNVMVQPKGYFVGSAALPFNYQGVTGSTKSDFSWNDLAFMVANNGYLKKWKMGTAVSAALDGNANYDEQPVPVNFNDFFARRTGVDAAYTVFLYKNGVLVNAFLGGGDSTQIPLFVRNMPALNVQMVAGIQFNINFSSYTNVIAEYVPTEVGTDNGYIRSRDGLCGLWIKSSSGVQHTPKETNGSQIAITGDVEVFTTVERGATAMDPSTVLYRLISAPAEAIPLVVTVYLDNGTKPGELDPNDGFVASNTVTELNTDFTINFTPRNASVIVTIATPAGCYDKVVYVSNSAILNHDPVSFVRPTRETAEQGIVLKKNPVRNELSFTFFAITTDVTDISIYS